MNVDALMQIDRPNLNKELLGKRLTLGINNLTNATTSKFIRKFYGCETCPYRGTEVCPHGIKDGERHQNGICSFRADQLHQIMDLTNSNVAAFQQDHILKSFILLEKLRDDYAETGRIPQFYDKLEKNFIVLVDKFRKQTEGIKINNEARNTHDEIRRIVEVQGKIVKDAEIIQRPSTDESSSSSGENPQVQN